MAQASLKYVTVDVFTHTPYEGNPLAIVHVPRTTTLTQNQKQTIAREFNYSETVFLHESAGNNEWQVDIFTTEQELPLAGHPVIGTTHYVLSQISTEQNEAATGTLITKAGRIPITLLEARSEGGSRRATAQIPHNVHMHKNSMSRSELFALQPDLKHHFDKIDVQDIPVFSIVKGMTFALIPLGSREALAAVRTASRRPQVELDPEWDESFVGSYFFYLRESGPERLTMDTRMIDAQLEDPATGSAACALSSSLALEAAKTIGQCNIKFDITQGEDMGRKSVIGVKVAMGKDAQVSSVTLAGTAVKIMSGEVAIPPV